jgi:hypothetical protein
MSEEHKILRVGSRDAGEAASKAEAELDAHSADGWSIVTAYAVESPLNAALSHFFVLQRPKPQPKE